MAKLKVMEAATFTDENKTTIVRLMNKLWKVQTDTITQERVLQGLSNLFTPAEWEKELTDNIEFFADNQMTMTEINKVGKIGKYTAEQISELTEEILKFNLDTPAIKEFVKDNVSELAKLLTEPLKENMKNIFSTAVNNELTLSEVTELLRPGMTLTERGYNAVFNYYEKLKGLEGMTPSNLNRLTRQYYNKAKRLRADVIARTELTRIKGFGERQAINQAINKKIIKGMNKTWVKGNYKDNWESSDMYDGMTIGINESFAKFGTPSNTTMLDFMEPGEINEYCYLEYDPVM